MLNFIKKYWPTALATLILLTALTGVYAKYVTDQALEERKITITAELGTIQLLEHEAVKQNDGSYVLQGVGTDGKCDGTEHTHLDGSAEKDGNKYEYVLPGLDIPKDPYVQITNKSPIEAYVFLKIETDNLKENGLTYTLKEHWQPVSDHPNVYVYSAKSDENWAPFQVTGDNTSTFTIPVLENNKVVVSQKLNKEATGLELSFSACMKQYVDGQTAAQIYGNT